MAKLDLLEKKSIIGMIHTLALPGTMDYCGDMTKVIDRALADLHAMQNAGVDAVIVENFCDHPAGTKLEPEQMAADRRGHGRGARGDHPGRHRCGVL